MKDILEDKYPSLYSEPISIYESSRVKTRSKRRVSMYTATIKKVEDEEICLHPEEYLVYTSFYDFKKFVDFSPPTGSLLIMSTSEPYDEEGAIEAEKIENWCKYFGLKSSRIHFSGHMNGPDLIRMLEEINPHVILPIHMTAENAQLIKKKFPTRVKILEEGERFEVKPGLLSYF